MTLMESEYSIVQIEQSNTSMLKHHENTFVFRNCKCTDSVHLLVDIIDSCLNDNVNIDVTISHICYFNGGYFYSWIFVMSVRPDIPNMFILQTCSSNLLIVRGSQSADR